MIVAGSGTSAPRPRVPEAVMLNDREQRVLRELEQQFLADDPEFPRSFDTRAQRLGRARGATSTRVALVIALLIGAVMLAAGSLAGALASGALIGLIWLAQRRSAARRDHRPDGDRPA
jgi:DUF3040 family protein